MGEKSNLLQFKTNFVQIVAVKVHNFAVFPVGDGFPVPPFSTVPTVGQGLAPAAVPPQRQTKKEGEKPLPYFLSIILCTFLSAVP